MFPCSPDGPHVQDSCLSGRQTVRRPLVSFLPVVKRFVVYMQLHCCAEHPVLKLNITEFTALKYFTSSEFMRLNGNKIIKS